MPMFMRMGLGPGGVELAELLHLPEGALAGADRVIHLGQGAPRST